MEERYRKINTLITTKKRKSNNT